MPGTYIMYKNNLKTKDRVKRKKDKVKLCYLYNFREIIM